MEDHVEGSEPGRPDVLRGGALDADSEGPEEAGGPQRLVRDGVYRLGALAGLRLELQRLRSQREGW